MLTEAEIQLIVNLHPDDAIDFAERSAIAEFMGGLNRYEAERMALHEVMSKRIKTPKIDTGQIVG